MAGQHHRCWAEIDLAAFERNLKRIQAALPSGVRYVAVVKADAYGHGMPQMVRRLMQSGVDCFGVANVAEAADIRRIGRGWPILVMGPVLEEEEEALVAHDLVATLSTLQEAERFEALGKRHGRCVRAHLKIDTGMGRLGVWHEGTAEFWKRLQQLPHVRVEGFYTHFSSADSDAEFTEQQRERFLRALDVCRAGKSFSGQPMVHADNSAALSSMKGDSPFSAVRIGLLQFGIRPYPESLLGRVEVEPVFSFRTRVGIVKTLPAGTDISYGRTHRLARDTRIAVLTGGYGDGIPVAQSNVGRVLIRGKPRPILGRVTMDQTIVDVTEPDDIAPGDIATIIGEDKGASISAAEFSRTGNTIPWETLCSITKRVTRLYTGAREI